MEKNKGFMSSKVMVVRALIISLMIFLSTTIQAQIPADFSGNWKFDIAKSKAGEGSSFGSSDIVHLIVQKPASITIEEKIGQQDYTITETFPLDGKEISETKGSRILKKSSSWSPDKKELKLITIMTIAGQDYRIEDLYKLSGNGLILTVQSVTKDPNGESTTICVYNKIKK